MKDRERMWCIAVMMSLLAAVAYPQQWDSTRISIHELESSQHQWDVMKADSSHPDLLRGKQLAIQGDVRGAKAAFQHALKHDRASAYFNLGVIAVAEDRYEHALVCFRRSYRARKDSVCLDQLRNVQRVLAARRKLQ